jgi:hypothetical protein
MAQRTAQAQTAFWQNEPKDSFWRNEPENYGNSFWQNEPKISNSFNGSSKTARPRERTGMLPHKAIMLQKKPSLGGVGPAPSKHSGNLIAFERLPMG